MERQVIGLERQNIAELDVIERLAATIGFEAFEADVARLVKLHIVDLEAAIQLIPRLVNPSLIGMSDVPFEVLQKASNALVEREPMLLERPSYRCHDTDVTALPWTLWLTLVRHARDFFDPAAFDADFLVAKMTAGLSSREAFDALIAYKRGRLPGLNLIAITQQPDLGGGESMEKVDPALLEAALRAFGNEARALRWLTTPVRTLGGRSPADADLKEALDLLARVVHGFSA